MEKRKKDILENLVLVVILLVLVQTFIEDFAVLKQWSWSARKVLLLTAFFFDLFFTVEFFARLYSALGRGEVREYLILRKGWIDLLASVPLLLLISGPSLLALLAGGGASAGAAGAMNMLKVVKAVRIARILRLLRILKIFKQIKNADSVMAQRHVSMIVSTAVTVIVFVILISSVINQALNLPSAERSSEEANLDAIMAYSDGKTAEAEMYSNLLIVKKGGNTVFTRYDNDYYSKYFGPNDYQHAEYQNYHFFFDYRGVAAINARERITFFLMIIAIVLVYTFFYSAHFAVTVSDPIHVMRRGMEERTYNFEVRVNPDYKDDDIFILAKDYNDIYLPMKDLSQSEESDLDAGTLELKMDDLKDLF